MTREEDRMSELIMACTKLKTAMSNNYAVERYIIMKSPNYTHPGWAELKRRKNYGK